MMYDMDKKKKKRGGMAKGGVYGSRQAMNKGRMVYKHGGKHNEKIMYAMGGEVQSPN